jgi:hypothetical protein
MYTGTLISDLMAAVERVERSAQQRRGVDEMELRRIFELQLSPTPNEPAYAGAA